MMSVHEMPGEVLPPTKEEAYQLGHDYVAHGASHTNCRFNIFCDPESVAAWEAGRLGAEREARLADEGKDVPPSDSMSIL